MQSPAAQHSNDWQHNLALGHLISKIQQPGWQAACLEHYALACHLSHAAACDVDSQASSLLPYVRLHGTRLKLLAGLVGPAAAAQAAAVAAVTSPDGCNVDARGAAAAAANQASTAAAGSADAEPTVGRASEGVMVQLLELLELLSLWCFDLDRALKLQQELLPQLRRQLDEQAALTGQEQQQQQQLVRLYQELAQQWHWEDAPSPAAFGARQAEAAAAEADAAQHSSRQADGAAVSLWPWQQAVSLLVDDCCAALSFCSSCCVRPLGPACYSHARGLFRLGR